MVRVFVIVIDDIGCEEYPYYRVICDNPSLSKGLQKRAIRYALSILPPHSGGEYFKRDTYNRPYVEIRSEEYNGKLPTTNILYNE